MTNNVGIYILYFYIYEYNNNNNLDLLFQKKCSTNYGIF